MLNMKHKKSATKGGVGTRILISVTVVGSAGPIRFVVKEDVTVGEVVGIALKAYAREGRLPVLGTSFIDFVLYCPVAGTEALMPWEMIGSFGVRNFMLCKKPQQKAVNGGDDEKSVNVRMTRKSSGSWRSWFNKSLNLKVSSH